MLINYLDYILLKLNRDQVDAYSRYAHALSVSSAIGAIGMLFTIDDLSAFKFITLSIVTILLFKFGTYILREKNDD
jgi:hypothetical protein